MDIFERNETVKFTQLLRTKIKHKRQNKQKALDNNQLYEKAVKDQEEKMREIPRRYAHIRRTFDLEKKGLKVNYTLFDEEAEIFRKMRHSKMERFSRLRSQFWAMCEKHLDRPVQLESDYVLARVYKHCCILFDLEQILGNKEIENEFYHFKEMFDTRARKEAVRKEFHTMIKQVHARRADILASDQKPDFFEQQGFSYDDSTFDDIYVKKFREILNVSTDSSDDDDESDEPENPLNVPQEQQEESKTGSSMFDMNDNSHEDQQIPTSAANNQGPPVEELEEPQEIFDDSEMLRDVDPAKFNWFKYLIDKHLQYKDDEGNVSALNSADSYSNVLNIITSKKFDEEIQEELLDFVGFHNFTLLQELIAKRDAIKIYVAQVGEQLKDERATGRREYKGKNNQHAAPVTTGVSVVVRQKGKKGKYKDKNAALQEQDQFKNSNHEVLRALGFSDTLIEESKNAGLKPQENKLSLRQYMIQQAEAERRQMLSDLQGDAASNTYQSKDVHKNYEIKEEDTFDWRFIQLVPPPKGDKNEEGLIKIVDLPKFCQGAFGLTKTLNRIQSIVHPVALQQSRSLIVCAPTGAGKTNVALMTVLREVSQHVDVASSGPWDLSNKQFQIVYIAPLKALAAEIVDKFQKALAYLKLKVRELTGDMSISKAEIGETHVIVATPEKWDVVTRKTDGMMDRVNCLIIDEIHLLNDVRGVVLECLVARALTTGLKNQKPIRIVGLSATLPNYNEVAEFIGADAKGTFYFDGSYRPTPLKCSFYGVKEITNAARANNIMNDIIYENLKRMLTMGKQVIIFAHKRAETYATAMELIEMIKEKGDADLWECENAWKVKKDVDRSTNQQVQHLFPHGFGIHHAGMLRKDRNLVEMLFSQGHIKVLCSTATLAWGVNLPAYGVIIKGTKVYDSNEGGYKDVSVFDVQQIFGRAGRPQFDTEGEAIILTQHKQVDHYVKSLSNKQPVESHLIEGLDNCINAEIAAGTVSTVTEGVQWLKKTFFYQRVKRNPIAYGHTHAELQQDPTAHMILLDKVTKSIQKLNRLQLIRYNIQTEGVFATDMGRISCNYYINCQTMNNFMSNLNANTREDLFLYHLSQASEFKQLEARKDEIQELKLLCQDVIFVEIDKTQFNEAHTKVLVLLECYLRRISCKTFSLISDMAYVAQNVARLLRAMFEISMQKNFANLAKVALNWCKIVDKRLKPNDHPMKQFCMDSWLGKLTSGSNEKVTRFGYLKDETVYQLKRHDISLDNIYDRELDEIKRYLSPGMIDELYKFAGYLPYFEIEIDCQPITRAILKVQVRLIPDFEWSDRWNGKNEPFWFIIDNETEILHQEYFQLLKKDVRPKGKRIKNDEGVLLTFFIPYEVEEGQRRISSGEYYNLTILSDRWFDISYYKNINLGELDVPDEDFPNTKLLNLRPLSIKCLGNEKYEALYREKFKFFNPVQTQVFHTLFHTDSNSLIGAPTGSGKTIMSELAMLRVFKNTPQSKVIFIAPLKALAKERIKDWKKRLEQGALQKSVLELTGDVTPDLKALQKADVLITTPEKWDGISRNWQHRSYVSAVALVIIDEIHLLGQERGPVIEVIVSRMRYISEQTGNNVRFVGLSTALANAKDVADWMGVHKLGLYNFKPSVRPVPIKVFFEGFAEKHYCPRMATMNRPSYKAIMTHSRNNPVLIFVSSRRQTRLTALDLIALSAADAMSGGELGFKKPFLHMDHEEIAQLSEFIKDENLRHTIQFGVGMHHAGLTESDRKVVEELFVKKKIQVLVTTSTLAWGVNFPARLVIVKGTEYYDASVKRYVDFPLTDLLQMIGRSGRPGMDDCGIACVMVAEEKKNFYKKFLYEPFPVESSLADQLTDHLNAEIASGTLQKFQHCIDYLTWTYFFRRLTKNPAFYGLKNNVMDNIAQVINNYLNALVQKTIDKLVRAKCVEYDKESQSLSPTTLGYLASFYYLSHETIQQLGDDIEPRAQIDELIQVLSNAKEFAGLPVRHNEDVLNEALTHLVPFRVAKHELESPHVKSNLLLQAHFERCPLPITDYISDTKSVLDQSIRILQGMIDISSHKGYMSATMNCIHMIQMIIQGQWLDHSPLINVPHFQDGEIIRKLGKVGVFNLPQLVMKCLYGDIKAYFDNVVKHSLPNEDLREIYRALEKVPVVELKYSLAKCNSQEEIQSNQRLEEGGEAVLMINLKRTNKSNKQFVSIANFPKPKECTWFLVVGNEETNELLGMKRIAFKRFASKKLTICLPNNFKTEHLQIYLLCDSYIGLDQQYSVDLSKINEAIRVENDQLQEIQVAEDADFDNLSMIDPEADETEQPQAFSKPSNAKEEAKGEAQEGGYHALFSQGYAQFDEMQRQIVDDIVSDDDKPKRKKPSSQPKVDESQIESSAYKNIEMGIEMLLDSDSDDEPPVQEEDGMIEKDLDNWF